MGVPLAAGLQWNPGMSSPLGRKVLMLNKDEIAGKAEALKGKVKQGVGDLTDNPELEAEGVADEAAGNVRKGVGTVKHKVGDAIKDFGDRIKK